MYPHRIRLRGPWECDPPDRPTCFTRRFHAPARLDPEERAWLTFDGVPGPAEVWVNGVLLGAYEVRDGRFACDVTHRLRTSNTLRVTVSEPVAARPGQPWAEVALEIRRGAYLKDVAAQAVFTGGEATLHATGTVAGAADRLLEIYLLLDNATVGYATCPAPFTFHLASESLPAARCRPGGVVRVDLIDVATMWYTVREPLRLDPPAETS